MRIMPSSILPQPKPTPRSPRFTTREALRTWIGELSIWAAALCLGMTVVFSLTVILLPLSMLLVAAAAACLGLGWLAGLIAPLFWQYGAVVCPYCRRRNLVRLNLRQFRCFGCDRPVRVIRAAGGDFLTLVRPGKRR